MSRFRFIAADEPLSEIDQSGFIRLKVKDIKKMNLRPKSSIPLEKLDDETEVLYAQSENDLGGLHISKCNYPPYEIDQYIQKKYIYWLDGNLQNKCLNQLVDYLKENIKRSNHAEILSIWLGDEKEDIAEYRLKLEEISCKNLSILENNDCRIILD